MAIALSTLVEEADRFLEAAKIQDYCPNGLQVEGRPQVSRIVTGVTASQALLDAAVEAEADLVQHDVDVTALGYEVGTVPGESPAWAADPRLRALALEAAQEVGGVRVIEGVMPNGSSDSSSQ